MCFNKKLKRQIETLQESVTALKKSIETNELIRLREVQKKYVESEGNLKNIPLRVKNFKYSEQDHNAVVTYEIDPIVLTFDENGDVEENKVFKSINLLNLIPLEDMIEIQKKLNKIKQNY